MRKEEVLILGREDVVETSRGKDILLINFTDFKGLKIFLREALVIFIDDNGHTKIIKNRYGDKGNNLFIRAIEDIKTNNEVCVALNAHMDETYFKDMISLYSY